MQIIAYLFKNTDFAYLNILTFQKNIVIQVFFFCNS